MKSKLCMYNDFCKKTEMGVEDWVTLRWKDEVEGLCSQILTVLSPLQEARTAGTPSAPVVGFQAKPHTLSVCPSSFWISFSSALSSVTIAIMYYTREFDLMWLCKRVSVCVCVFSRPGLDKSRPTCYWAFLFYFYGCLIMFLFYFLCINYSC